MSINHGLQAKIQGPRVRRWCNQTDRQTDLPGVGTPVDVIRQTDRQTDLPGVGTPVDVIRQTDRQTYLGWAHLWM